MVSRTGRKAFRRLLAGRSEGFAAVDGLVALSILASTLILALGAAATAQRSAAAALEARRANTLMAFLMNSSRPGAGAWSGADRGLEWTLQITAAADNAPSSGWSLCRRSAEVASERSGRRYRLATTEPCAIGQAS